MTLILAGAVAAGGAPALLSQTLSPLHTGIAAALGLLLAGASVACTAPGLRVAAWLVAAMALGFALGGAQVRALVQGQLAAQWEGQNQRLLVEVAGLPRRAAEGLRFDARVVASDSPRGELAAPENPGLRGRLIRLAWRAGAELRPGQRWWLNVRLQRPRGFANPRGFDYQAWLLAQGIAARGYVVGDAAAGAQAEQKGNVLVEATRGPSLDRLRYRISQTLSAAGANTLAYRGLMQALLVGDRADISAPQWRVLSATGTVHLVAISGLHVGLIAGLVFWLASRLSAVLPLHSARVIRAWPALASVAAAAGYAALAGFAIPTQRALVFIALLNWVYWSGRRCASGRLLLLSALLVVLNEPLAFLQSGFWLSFGAAGFLLYFFGHRGRRLSWGASLLQAQMVAGIGLAPLLMALNLPQSAVSPLANLVAVPLISVAVVPGLLGAALLGFVQPQWAATLLAGLDWLLGGLWRYLELVQGLAGRQWFALPDTPLAVVLALLACLLLFSPAALRLRVLAAAVLLAIGVAGWRQPRDPFTFTVIDVGQGLAVSISGADHQLLYDTGARFSDNFDLGSRVVAPYLHSVGVRALDRVIVSHGDNDHAGGLAGLLDQVPAAGLLAGEPAKVAASAGAVPSARCVRGQRWQSGGLSFAFLWPLAELPAATSANNRSCVLLVRYRDYQFLLMGDVDEAVERQLLALGGLPRKVDVLVAAHHGSATSSSVAFIRRVAPRRVIFSSGYRNRYHHPAPRVVERFRIEGVQTWNTAGQGAITVAVDSEGVLRIEAERRRRPKPWYGN